MDNVAHGLWGLGIYAGWTAIAHPAAQTSVAVGVCLAAVAGSEVPDVDYLVKLVFGPVAYLRHHRASSHSIPAWFVWPLLIALLLSIGWHGEFGLFYLISFIGVVIHVGLDVLTTYGTQALWPFSRRRWSFDVLFIVDGVVLLCGILGTLMVATGKWSVGHAGLLMGTIVVFYLAIRCVHAALMYEKVRKSFPDSWKVSTIPGPLPWMWNFVAQTQNELMAGKLTWQGEVKREVHWRWDQRDDEAFQFVTRFTRVGSVFHWFARHLIWAESYEGDSIRISLADVTQRFNGRLQTMGHVTLRKLDSGRYEVLEESIKSTRQDEDALLGDAVLANVRMRTSLRWFG